MAKWITVGGVGFVIWYIGVSIGHFVTINDYTGASDSIIHIGLAASCTLGTLGAWWRIQYLNTSEHLIKFFTNEIKKVHEDLSNKIEALNDKRDDDRETNRMDNANHSKHYNGSSIVQVDAAERH